MNKVSKLFSFCSMILFLVALTTALSAQRPASTMDTFKGDAPEVSDGFSCDVDLPVLIQGPNAVNGIFSDSDCNSCGGGEQYISDDFTPAADATLTNICFYGGYFPFNSIPTDDLTVIYYLDAGGIPGAVHAGPFSVTATRATTGNVLFGVDEWNYTAIHPGVNVSAGTTYHISIFNNTTGNSDTWFWETGDLDPATGVDNFAFSFDNSSWIVGGPGVNFAISIGSETAIVPTLGEWSVIILGLLFLIVGIVAVTQKKRAIA